MEPQPPPTLTEWAHQHGLSHRPAPPAARAGEPCPCSRETVPIWLWVALAIAASAWWF